MDSALHQVFLTTSYGTAAERFQLASADPTTSVPSAPPSWANGQRGWAIITAWNPHGKRQAEVQNAQAQELLLQAAAKLPHLAGMNGDGAWREEAIIVRAISLGRAVVLGRQFSQEAVLFGVGRRVALVTLGQQVEVTRRWVNWD